MLDQEEYQILPRKREQAPSANCAVRTLDSNSQSPLEAAGTYASFGWRVFPVHTVQSGRCSCRDVECKSPGKHPRVKAWPSAATTDPARIREWWKRYPDANIAVATGRESGLLVMDFDGAEGEETRQQWIDQYPGQMETLSALTGNGMHQFYGCPDFPIGSGTKVAPGVDIRADGGYIILAPSQHVSGRRYRWIDDPQVVLTAPNWLLEIVTEAKRPPPLRIGNPTLSGEIYTGGRIPVGERNNTLFKLAAGMRARGLEHEEIRSELMSINETECEEPLDTGELQEIAASASKYPQGSPGVVMNPDENRLPFMPFWVDGFLANRDVLLMNDCQRGQYICLVAEAWKSGGVLPYDVSLLHRLSRASCSVKKFQKGLPAVRAPFEVCEGEPPVIIHRILSRLYQEQMQKWEQKVRAGNKSAEKRRSVKVEESVQ